MCPVKWNEMKMNFCCTLGCLKNDNGIKVLNGRRLKDFTNLHSGFSWNNNDLIPARGIFCYIRVFLLEVKTKLNSSSYRKKIHQTQVFVSNNFFLFSIKRKYAIKRTDSFDPNPFSTRSEKERFIKGWRIVLRELSLKQRFNKRFQKCFSRNVYTIRTESESWPKTRPDHIKFKISCVSENPVHLSDKSIN